MDREPGPLIGGLGFIATIGLEQINVIVSLLVGLATLAFVVTRWMFFVKKHGGFSALFFSPPSPPAAPAARRYCEECPRNPDQN